MRLGYTAAQIRAAEAPFLERGVPLMQRASEALAEHVTSLLPVPREARILVLAGAGDNGGDALHAAALIRASGATVEIAPAMGPLHDAGAAAALDAGAMIVAVPEPGAPAVPALVAESITAYDVVVDGILGIGSGGIAAGGTPALRGAPRELVRTIRAAIDSASGGTPLVVAVDIPSGIDPDDGGVPDPDSVLRAHLTVTFIGIKAGLLLDPAAGFAGKVWLEPIGAGQALLGVTPAVQIAGRPTVDGASSRPAGL